MDIAWTESEDGAVTCVLLDGSGSVVATETMSFDATDVERRGVEEALRKEASATIRSTTISTRITPDLKARVHRFAADRCVGVVLVIEQALTEYLDARSEDRGLTEHTRLQANPARHLLARKQGGSVG